MAKYAESDKAYGKLPRKKKKKLPKGQAKGNKKNDTKVAYTPIPEAEKEKRIKQLIKDLTSGKKTVPISYPNQRWKI